MKVFIWNQAVGYSLDCLVIYADNLEDARIEAMSDGRFNKDYGDWFTYTEPTEILDLNTNNPVHYCSYYE